MVTSGEPTLITMEGELDKELRVVRVNDAVLAMGNLPEFHREMDLAVSNLSFMTDLQAERFECMARRAMSSGETEMDDQLRQLPNGEWVIVKGYFSRNRNGVFNRNIIYGLDLVFGSWPSKLKGGRLWLVDTVSLSAKEMKVLHYYVSGLSAKQTSPFVCTGTRGVEVALGRIKDKLRLDSHPDLSLTQNLNKRRLIEFLLLQSDWFNIESTYRTQWN